MYERFPTPVVRFNARLNYARSLAIWSMVGALMGLGDRHGDNIILHVNSMKVSHIDFDCIFEKGFTLPVAEIVPFRLTRNIMDGLGLLKVSGVFESNCVLIVEIL